MSKHKSVLAELVPAFLCLFVVVIAVLIGAVIGGMIASHEVTRHNDKMLHMFSVALGKANQNISDLQDAQNAMVTDHRAIQDELDSCLSILKGQQTINEYLLAHSCKCDEPTPKPHPRPIPFTGNPGKGGSEWDNFYWDRGISGKAH